MQNLYDVDIIPIILKTFKVNNVVVSGVCDLNLINVISNCVANFIQINTNDDNSISGNPLNILPNLENYDAIFIDDDSNWFTVFNELKIIKKTNEEFPIVFICNNNFPNKRRDSYSNPDIVPSKYRQKYTNMFTVCYDGKEINVSDGFYHACEESTYKNGVLTAIEDFLKENSSIGVMKINFIKEICILYPRSQINQKRISVISKNIIDKEINNINLSDKLIENQLLISYIGKHDEYNDNFNDFEVEMSKKDRIINDYENKIKIQKDELALKDSKLSGFESNLSLKDSEIKNVKSKLVNRDMKINNLESELEVVNNNLNSLTQEINNKDIEINELNNNFKQEKSEYDAQINSLNNEFNQKELNFKNNENKYKEMIKIKEDQFNYQKILNNRKEDSFANQINSLSVKINQNEQDLKNIKNEYVEQIKIKNNKINTLKEDIEQKNNEFILKEDNLNNQIKIQKQELDKKNMKINSIEHSYVKQLSKIDNNKYCISCFKEEISNNHLEINYLKNKNKSLTNKIFNHLSYLYLIFKSNPKEMSVNIKLYRYLKDSECFDIGFYLNNNKDLIESKWCSYFSPELHYVCKGFNENRKFNKKYHNRKSKKDLLEYLLICEE